MGLLYLLICLILGSENSLRTSVLVLHFSLTVKISGCVDEVFGFSVVMFFYHPSQRVLSDYSGSQDACVIQTLPHRTHFDHEDGGRMFPEIFTFTP